MASPAAFGGAIYNEGELTVSGSSLFGNSATNDGGAIYNLGGNLYVGVSDFIGNSPNAIVGEYTDLGGNNFY
jgi:hypothetical protein